jgi:hypothetical protein
MLVSDQVGRISGQALAMFGAKFKRNLEQSRLGNVSPVVTNASPIVAESSHLILDSGCAHDYSLERPRT